MKNWKVLVPTLGGAGLFLALQLLLTPLLRMSVPGVPPLIPDPAIRGLLAVFAFVAGSIACHRPLPKSDARSLYRCCFRGFLWGLLVAGILFEFGTIMRFSLMPVRLAELFEMATVAFGFVWVVATTVFSRDALRLRSSPDPS